MYRSGGKSTCPVCGKVISNNGLAVYSHRQKHVRDGTLQVIQTRDGRMGTKEPEKGKP